MTTVLTIGHGTLSQDAFLDLLRATGVELVVDVRAQPGSRRNPQFGRDTMARWMSDRAFGYRWEPGLGGRRRGVVPSRHTAITNASFRAYADYMDTEEFEAALDRLVDDAASRSTAVMCAETLWWRCHRRLVADALELTRGCEVMHVFPNGTLAPHVPFSVARVSGGHVVYDGAP
jgi:uncharacterized protein (DUF488 family)